MKKTLIVGVGGAGTNIAHFLAENFNSSSELLLINSDKTSLDTHSMANLIFLDLTSSSETKKSKKFIDAIEDMKDDISKYTHDKEHILLAVGLGGDTGTYSVSAITKILRNSLKKVTLVVILPFHFETSRRRLAEEKFSKITNISGINLIAFDNQSLMSDKKTSLVEAFNKANATLLSQFIVRGIIPVISKNKESAS